MATQQDIFKAIQDIKDKIIEKGGTIQQENINVSLPELVAGVESIPTGGGGGYEIITAERPNYTIKVQDETGRDVATGNTGLEGGAVTLSVSKTGSYTVKAFSGDVEAWSNTVNIEQSGVYNVKSGLPLENYTEDEIKAAANGHYAKYMWNLWDSKKMESFMGSADEQYCTAYIIDFDKDDKKDGSGKAGITWLIPTTSARYNHKASGGSTTNNNGISWIGSLIKQNCMKAGEETYVYDNTATAASEGDYYEYDPETKAFNPVVISEVFETGRKFYKKVVLEEDGAFIAGLPETWKDKIVKVKKRTWGGYGLAAGKEDNTIIETEDWMFLMADSEVFGHEHRFATAYSKNTGVEGERYAAFKEYREDKFRFGITRWFRSPCVTNGSGFCAWYINGYVTSGTAPATSCCPLCFCF